MICGYISKENPFEDKLAWSGLIYKIREAIEYDTGGVGNYIINDVNGYRLPEGCGAEVFAIKIIETLTTENQDKLHNGCLKMYESTLSWNSWSLRFRKIIEKEIKRGL